MFFRRREFATWYFDNGDGLLNVFILHHPVLDAEIPLPANTHPRRPPESRYSEGRFFIFLATKLPKSPAPGSPVRRCVMFSLYLMQILGSFGLRSVSFGFEISEISKPLRTSYQTGHRNFLDISLFFARFLQGKYLHREYTALSGIRPWFPRKRD